MNILLSSMGVTLVDENERNINVLLFITGITSIVYLCIAIIVAYCFNFSFTKFLIAAYSYIIFRVIWVGIAYISKRNK
jgi:uncharacterized membrane protein